MDTFEVWYLRQDMSDIATSWMSRVSAKSAKRFERNVAKAQGKNSLRAFDKLTQIVDGEPRIVSDHRAWSRSRRSRAPPESRKSTTR
jgi:hypothetical protein